MDCIFCKIIAGEVPSLTVWEDEHTLVLMDIARDVDGHMLAIPKRHVHSLLDCDGDTLHRLMDTVKLVSEHCVACGYDGVNLLHASGEGADQSVPHLHIHIIPRRAGDGVDAWPCFAGEKETREVVFERLRMTKRP